MPLSKELEKDITSDLDNISLDEWILILLYARKEKHLNGKLMFVKQVFLLTHELFPYIKHKFKFYPASFGPYSIEFARAINKLVEEETIVMKEEKRGDYLIYRFLLDKTGKSLGEKAFKKLSDNERQTIQKKRKEWDLLGYKGILNYVYTKYPEYAVTSIIADKI